MTIEEWIKKAQSLFDEFPNDKYWLFVTDELHIMKRTLNGSRYVTYTGAVDQSKVVGSLSGFEIDGGSW